MGVSKKDLQKVVDAYKTLKVSMDKKEFSLDWLDYSKKN